MEVEPGIDITILFFTIVSAKRDLSHMFSQDRNSFLYARSLKCPLHIASYALRIGVSVIEL